MQTLFAAVAAVVLGFASTQAGVAAGHPPAAPDASALLVLPDQPQHA